MREIPRAQVVNMNAGDLHMGGLRDNNGSKWILLVKSRGVMIHDFKLFGGSSSWVAMPYGGPRERDVKGTRELVVVIYIGILEMVDGPTSPEDLLREMDTSGGMLVKAQLGRRWWGWWPDSLSKGWWWVEKLCQELDQHLLSRAWKLRCKFGGWHLPA